MTDQDLDGSHIKGLGVNLFQSIWPSLSVIPGFIGFMNTPILKARKGTSELMFYNNGEYDTWLETMNQDPKGWNIKYYKGLGTSTGKEFREYFANKKIVGFDHTGKETDDTIDMVFNKKRSDDRKTWLGNYERDSYLDTNKEIVSYDEFINKELIHFSKYDCDRSIPNLMDGLKISLRKILFASFKKNLTSEIKVAQFSGYVSEHSGYHHGEASLNAAIVGMGQNFVGSNNINLLVPSGQFGTRLQGGKDSASERYIFTYLNNITRKLFPVLDDPILTYLNDDGLMVEPIFYAPIIPMILVNGAKGIGTGFSTEVLPYNPDDIIEYLYRKLIDDTDLTKNWVDFVPYYEGFKGTIKRLTQHKFLVKGKYENQGNDKIRVTELPVGFWTDDFKSNLESLLDTTDANGKRIVPKIKDYDDMSKDVNVDFTIQFPKGKLSELESVKAEHDCNGVEKLLKLYTTISSSNMHLFNYDDKLKKYENVESIIDDYYLKRLELYDIRKKYMINETEKELVLLSNKVKYIQEVLKGTIDLRRKSKEVIDELLEAKQYDKLGKDKDYKYLVKMPMDSVSQENVEKLLNEHQKKEKELEKIQSTTIQEMWLNELKELGHAYSEYKEERSKLLDVESDLKNEKVTIKKVKKKIVK